MKTAVNFNLTIPDYIDPKGSKFTQWLDWELGPSGRLTIMLNNSFRDNFKEEIETYELPVDKDKQFV